MQSTENKLVASLKAEITVLRDDIKHLQSHIRDLKSDALTMACRLYGEDVDTFSPETYEVMKRWKKTVDEALKENYN